MNLRIIHIPTSETEEVRVEYVPSERLDQRLSELCRGYFQVVPMDNDTCLWLNEEGKIHGLPWNPRTQILWDAKYGAGTDIIVGPAVLTGGIGHDGETLGLNEEQFAGCLEALGLVHVRVENTFEDGLESTAEALLPAPSEFDADTLLEWFTDEVLLVASEAHGSGPTCSSYAKIIGGPAEIIGKSEEYVG